MMMSLDHPYTFFGYGELGRPESFEPIDTFSDRVSVNFFVDVLLDEGVSQLTRREWHISLM